MVVGLGNKRSTHSSHHHVGEQRRSSPYGRVGQLPHLPAEQTPLNHGLSQWPELVEQLLKTRTCVLSVGVGQPEEEEDL